MHSARSFGQVAMVLASATDLAIKYFSEKKEFFDFYEAIKTERSEFENYISACNQKKSRWHYVDKLFSLVGINTNFSKWYLYGYCEVCHTPTRFIIDWRVSDKKHPNYTLTMDCEYCGMSSRNRYFLSQIEKFSKNIISSKKTPVIYIQEQKTPFYKCAVKKLDKSQIMASEFLGGVIKSGTIIDGIRHEDMQNMSFETNSFDIISSLDVLEHIPDVKGALKETCRVLKKGGTFIFNTPIILANEKTLQRARLTNGQIEFLEPAIYHGDPAVHPLRFYLNRAKGVLVYNDFGWDLLQMCRDAGFSEAYLMGFYSYFHGYLGRPGVGGLEIAFIAKK